MTRHRMFFRGQSVILLYMIIVLAACSGQESAQHSGEDVPVVPYPQKVLKRSGYVKLDNNFWVIANVSDTAMARLGKYLVEEIDQIPGALASIADLYSTRNHEQAISIELVEDTELHPQGYRLTITSRKIQIQGTTEQGIYYGIQTILSLLRSNWNEGTRTAELRQMVIIDKPIHNIRIANLETESDSIDFRWLSRKLGQLKINYLVVPPGVNYAAASELAANYISLLPPEADLGTKPIKLTRNNEQMKSLFTRDQLIVADTMNCKITLAAEGKMSLEFYVAAQMGWSGRSQKDYQWLIAHSTMLED